MGAAGVYLIFKHNTRDVAAGAGMQEQQRTQGIPSHWLSYVRVANADDAASNAKSLGGSELIRPFDVMELGRMAILQDPTGRYFRHMASEGSRRYSRCGRSGDARVDRTLDDER